MLKNAQLPIRYHAFGVAVLSLETFGNVSSNETSFVYSKKNLNANSNVSIYFSGFSFNHQLLHGFEDTVRMIY